MNDEGLHRAARWGELKEVKRRMLKVFDIDCRGYSSQTPLHDATAGGYLSVIQCLMLDGAADPEARDDRNRTPLFYAVKKGHLHVVQYMVEQHRVNVMAHDIFGATPLHLACSEWHLPIVKYLVQYRPSMVYLTNHLGWNSLHVSAREGNAGICQVLLKTGGASMECKTHIGLTPLLVAVSAPAGSNVPLLQLLLREQGADLFATDNTGNTALHLCNSKVIAESLLEHAVKNGLAGKLLSVKNKTSTGETAAQRVRRCAHKELNSMIRNDRKELADYLESWQMRFAVPPKSDDDPAFELSVMLNPKLNKLQSLVADEICIILEDTLCTDALAISILGYLTPADVSMRWDLWNESKCMRRLPAGYENDEDSTKDDFEYDC